MLVYVSVFSLILQFGPEVKKFENTVGEFHGCRTTMRAFNSNGCGKYPGVALQSVCVCAGQVVDLIRSKLKLQTCGRCGADVSVTADCGADMEEWSPSGRLL